MSSLEPRARCLKGNDGPMLTALRRHNGGRGLLFGMNVFVVMMSQMRTHVSYYNNAERTKGMYRQCIQNAWGHTVQRSWARLLLAPRPHSGPHHPRPGAPQRQRRLKAIIYFCGLASPVQCLISQMEYKGK